MGTPNVFEFIKFTGIALGVRWSITDSEYGETLDICIFFPFMCIAIFCRKTPKNKWI